MNNTRRVGSNKLNLGYVTDTLSGRLSLPEAFLSRGNAVAVASVDEACAPASERVWRSYQLPRNGTQGFPVKPFLPDAVLLGPEVLVRGEDGERVFASQLAGISARYHHPHIVDLGKFSAHVGIEPADLERFAASIEDHVYFTPGQFAP